MVAEKKLDFSCFIFFSPIFICCLIASEFEIVVGLSRRRIISYTASSNKVVVK
jgi:hypothetical protein